MFCYIASIDNTGVVKRFHYYLSRQLIGDGTEIRMKKELEFNNNKYIITECWNYYRVELALQDEGNIPWYIENFIQYEIYDDFVSFYYEPNSQDWASPNYDEVISYKECKYGEDVKEIIENALLEIEKQKKLFEQMKQEAEISQQITTMNQEQVNALNTLLENTLNKQEKKTFPKTLLWNLFFCLLSAILGYILGKLL